MYHNARWNLYLDLERQNLEHEKNTDSCRSEDGFSGTRKHNPGTKKELILGKIDGISTRFLTTGI